MLPPQEVLLSCHIELIYALVKNASSHQPTPEAIKENFTRLENCYTTFQGLKHPLYTARAALFLALAHLQNARPDESRPLTAGGAQELAAAEEYANEVLQYFTSTGLLRYKLYQLLIRSQIHRKADRLQDAEDDANKGLQISSVSRPVFLELKLARGEARSRNGKRKEAILDFEEGYQLARDGKIVQLQATFLLQLCVSKALEGDDRAAAQHWAEFNDLRLPVKTRPLRILEGQARELLNQVSSDFVLRFSDDAFDPKVEEKKFRQFLVKWARSKQKVANDKAAAKLLNISRQTLYKWLQ
jgi:tetratricopeptide (TPR) repeat protein